jgi:hypothetical protein
MAKIMFSGLCSGTVTRHSDKSGKDYSITSFVEYPSLQKFEVFGDLGLVAHLEVKDYVLEAGVEKLSFPKVVSAIPAVNVPVVGSSVKK